MSSPRSRTGRGLWVASAAVLSALGLLLYPAGRADAFCPTNGYKCGFGLVGVTHKDMTKQAITELDREFFGTDKLTKGMKTAIEDLWTANAEVDEDQTNGFKHFDGESFSAGKERLASLAQRAVEQLQAEDAKGARQSVGQALHTLQDFYSHSDYVETGGGGALSALWRSDASLPAAAAPTATTCRDCVWVSDLEGNLTLDCSGNLATSLLTSGYYGGERERPQVATKCRHGGPFDSGPGPLGGINKDTVFNTFSPHGDRHYAAAGSALEASKAFVRDLKERLTPRQLKLLLGVGPTLAFAVDTTGSMGGIISQVRSQTIALVDARLGTDEEPLQYVLAPFNDPSTGPITVTDDADRFKAALSNLYAWGGDDCPELSMTGTLQAISAADDGADVFVFTDADAKDGSLAGSVSALADQKSSRVYTPLFGSCSGYLADPGQSAGAGVWRDAGEGGAQGLVASALFGDPAYRRITSDSGGQSFRLSYYDASRIVALADAAARANAVALLSVADDATTSRSYALPVDSTLSRVTFSLSGTTGLRVVRPDGRTAASGDPDVSVLSLYDGVLVTVKAPAAGTWTANVTPRGAFSLNVLGDSPVALDRFGFVGVRGRPAHQGYFPVRGLPVVGDAHTGTAELSGPVASARIELRTKAGQLLAQPALVTEPQGDPLELFGPVDLPASPYVVYATGTLAGGEPFQRTLSRTVQAQTVRVSAPPAQNLGPGTTTRYAFTVTNLGAPDTFRVTAVDDRRFLSSGSGQWLSLGTGESGTASFTLAVPAWVAPTGSDTLTVTAEGGSGAHNYALLESPIGVQVTVDCRGAAASAVQLWPPNHDLVPVQVTGVTASDGSAVSVSVDQVLQSEPALGKGDGQTCPDASGLGTDTVQLRAERSGGAAGGRTYELRFSASAAGGAARCEGTVRVCVPHDAGGTCTPDAPVTYDSGVCR